MANVTNTFIKSKMNKDLDDRLLSDGEYRDATNVNISRSEGDDVGALENVLGNFPPNGGILARFGCEAIGYFVDDANACVYTFLTNYNDPTETTSASYNGLETIPAPPGAECFIVKTSLDTNNFGISLVLVSGSFLNFSKSHGVYGVDLVEDLLFFTDDRNQPRKINVNLARSVLGPAPTYYGAYYTNEDQISVAKYYPFKVPYLYESVTVSILAESSSYPGRLLVSIADALKLRAGDILKIPYQNIVNGNNPSTEIFYPIQITEVNYGGLTGISGTDFLTNFTPNPTIFNTSVTFLRPSSKRVTPEYLPEFNSGAFVSQQTDTTTQPGTNLYEVTLNKWWSAGNNIGINTRVIGNFDNATPILTTLSQNIIGGHPQNSDTRTFRVNQPLSPTPTVGDLIAFRQPNPEYTDTWPGDADLLSDKFVRFAYRFKFDDGEYSLISPFTQPAFIPKQDGYFNTFVKQKNIIPGISSQTDSYRSDLEETQASTIVSFFENKVQDITISIETEFIVNKLAEDLHVSEIDILYKESDGLAIQVLETISVTDSSITGNSTKIIDYKYQSKKPFRTLPAREINRVFDKVPIRAKSQSISGGRVIYGNFLNKHTPPENLNYGVSISDKSRPTDKSTPSTPGNISNLNFSTIAYPNHTVKQNRNYQVGIVLSDRYGRQSDVILSSVKDFEFKQTNGTEVFGGSSIYHPYKEAGATYRDRGNSSSAFGVNDVFNGSAAMPFSWFGDSIKVLFMGKIPSTVSYADGYPGLYKSDVYEVTVAANSNINIIELESIDPNIQVGDILIQNNQKYSIMVIDLGALEITLSSSINVSLNDKLEIRGLSPNYLGWYSYKVVVKQQKQEYYNAYLPLIVNDIPGGIDSNSVTQAYTTLISDNINKIPPDLGEVQPEQTQFRTSDELLFPRVLTSNFSLSYVQANVGADIYVQGAFGFQASLGEKYFVIDTIGKVTDLGVNTNDTTATPPELITAAPGIYDAKSNPPIGKISTFSTQAGYSSKSSLANYPGPSPTPVTRVSGLSQAISVLEVDPPESRLDIYWETSTTGLVSELNADIDAGPAAVEVLPSPPTSGTDEEEIES